MASWAIPVLSVLFLWWFSTGVIFFLDGLPRHTYRWSLAGAGVLAVAALIVVAATTGDSSQEAAYLAFTASLVLWGWNEMAFLMGVVTGPRRSACPSGLSGWRHFIAAAGTLIHHELAIAATAAVLIVLTWGAENPVALWSFVVLWTMRLSSKFNLYLGVLNRGEEVLPAHLAHLASFLGTARCNWLFPISVTVATAAAAVLIDAGWAASAAGQDPTGLWLVTTLLVLGLVEHWAMVLPVRTTMLWAWSLRDRLRPASDLDPAVAPTVTVEPALHPVRHRSHPPGLAPRWRRS